MILDRVRRRDSLFQILGLADTQGPERVLDLRLGSMGRGRCVSGVPVAFVGTGPQVTLAEQLVGARAAAVVAASRPRAGPKEKYLTLCV